MGFWALPRKYASRGGVHWATDNQVGKFEQAHEGTLFLDERLNRSFRRQRRFAPAAIRKLNVRQLEGVLTNAVILSATDLMEADDLDLDTVSLAFEFPEPAEGFDMEAFLTDARATLIDRALTAAKGNQSQAARLVSMTPQNISKFLRSESNSWLKTYNS